MQQFVSAAEAVKVIQPGNRVFVHTAAAAPQLLVQALTERASELSKVELIHLHTEGPAPYVDRKYAGTFFTNALFIGGNVRAAMPTEMADYIPIFLSDTPSLFRKGHMPVDVAMLTLSPPRSQRMVQFGGVGRL